MTDLSPFGLSDIADGEDVTFYLSMSRFDDYEEIFRACGYEGGGYDWEAVARQIIRASAPHLAERIRFDPEGSLFTAYGNDQDALIELATHMKKVMADKESLTATINAADPDWFD